MTAEPPDAPKRLNREEVRSVDRIAIEEFSLTGLVLMENAGRGAAEVIAQSISPSWSIGILCGGGNNGGDGYVIARHLQLAGYSVAILSLANLDRLSPDADANAKIAGLAEIPITVAKSRDDIEVFLQGCPVVLDCLLGTGATGEPRGLYRDAIELANELAETRFAIDIPTGLDCDSGEASTETFRADETITFVAEKAGFANAAEFIGKVTVVGIGVPRILLERFKLN